MVQHSATKKSDFELVSRTTYDDIIFALKKFTGGMGDEDEEQPGDNKTW